jgi:enoyl-CoA hydratase/carnithine racemase
LPDGETRCGGCSPEISSTQAEALRIGVVQEIVAASDLLERATAIASRIAEQAPLGVRATLASANADEGIKSFVERRAGVFKAK